MAYLFSFFTTEDLGGEQVYFSISRDGLHWKDLSDKPALTWNQGDMGVRDPFLVKHPITGMYYVMATDLCIKRRNHQWGDAQYQGSRDLIFWSSTDLLTWSEPWSVTLAPEGAGCAWAPEAIWDEEKQTFQIFFASMTHYDEVTKQRIHAAYTQDFKSFSPVFRYIEREGHIIDTTIIHHDGMYYRFSAAGGIRGDYGPSLTGEFQPLSVPLLETLHGLEGPECYQLPDGRWCLIADRFKQRLGYLPIVFDDLAAGEAHVLPDDAFDFGSLLKRHGGVVAISDEEYDRLAAQAGL